MRPLRWPRCCWARGLWWVCRRLFGNIPGAFALGLYCLSPVVLRYATTPNNEILAAWGLYAAVYTAIGIAHAMYGPPRKWKPRIILFTLALGLTACAHLLAAAVALIASAAFMLYIAERRRTLVLPLLLVSAAGALFLVLASFTFRLGLFTYVFTAGAARFVLDYQPALQFCGDFFQSPVMAVAGAAVVLFFVLRRARYFGNVVPLLMTAVLLPLETTQLSTVPTVWAMPFLLTFSAGIFADATETRHRKLYLAIMGMALGGQAVLCALWIWSGAGNR